MLFCIYQENTVYRKYHVHAQQIELLLLPWLHDKEIDGKRDFLSYKLKRHVTVINITYLLSGPMFSNPIEEMLEGQCASLYLDDPFMLFFSSFFGDFFVCFSQKAKQEAASAFIELAASGNH